MVPRIPVKWWIIWRNWALICCLSLEGTEHCGEGKRSMPKFAGEAARRCVIGIPKTIDNDIMYLDKSFGFDTAFAEAVKAVACAHVEAVGAMNGIGLVKLMGRHSGFISCYAAWRGNTSIIV